MAWKTGVSGGGIANRHVKFVLFLRYQYRLTNSHLSKSLKLRKEDQFGCMNLEDAYREIVFKTQGKHENRNMKEKLEKWRKRT